MQDIARRSVLGATASMLDPIRQHPACGILGRDVHSFVCCPMLDGDRRFEVRF
jgi:hypothetical protein